MKGKSSKKKTQNLFFSKKMRIRKPSEDIQNEFDYKYINKQNKIEPA